jgi:hypothetical protein
MSTIHPFRKRRDAIKAFAYYREIADGLFTESGLTDYLTLLSIQQTCVYKGVSFLKFLVSQELDIDRFCAANGRMRRDRLPYDLNPEGYIPPRRRRKGHLEGTTPIGDAASSEPIP